MAFSSIYRQPQSHCEPIICGRDADLPATWAVVYNEVSTATPESMGGGIDSNTSGKTTYLLGGLML